MHSELQIQHSRLWLFIEAIDFKSKTQIIEGVLVRPYLV